MVEAEGFLNMTRRNRATSRSYTSFSLTKYGCFARPRFGILNGRV